MFVVVVITQAKGHHSPPTPTPPPKKKIAKIYHFVSLKTFMKTVQNRLLSSKICLENFRRIGFF